MFKSVVSSYGCPSKRIQSLYIRMGPGPGGEAQPQASCWRPRWVIETAFPWNPLASANFFLSHTLCFSNFRSVANHIMCRRCQGREREPPLRKDTAVAHRAPDYVFVTCCLLLCGNNRNSQSIDRSINQSHLKALFSSSSDLYFSCLFISTAFGETKVF